MKAIRCFLYLWMIVLSSAGVYAQSVHNYFTSDIYPGLYAQVAYGQGYILFSIPPNGSARLDYAYRKDNVLYYSDGKFMVAMSADASALSAVIGGKAVTFTYVAPVTVSPVSPVPGIRGNGGTDVPQRRTKCYFCNGTGKVVENQSVPQYGLNDYYVYQTCPECGEKYNSTFVNHYHAICPKCFGNGYVER